jgi:hypothetical protein
VALGVSVEDVLKHEPQELFRVSSSGIGHGCQALVDRYQVALLE